MIQEYFPPEYGYVQEIDHDGPIEHGFSDLERKAQELGLAEARLMKTLFYQGAVGEKEGVVGAVLPAPERVDQKRLAEPLGISRTQARELSFAEEERFPYRQEIGTCGPWITEEDLEHVIGIVFHERVPEGPLEWVPPGVEGVSVIAPYREVREVLDSTFPGTYHSADIVE